MAKKKIFLSFAETDRELADAFHFLLTRVFGFDVFYSPVDLPKLIKGSSGWIAEISNAIERCNCFIIIITKNSVSSRWVLYETAIANGFGKDIVAAKTANVNNDTISKLLPSRKKNFYLDIDSRQGIWNFIKSVHNYLKDKTRDSAIEAQLKIPKANEKVKQILELSKERNVFIGGSFYTGDPRIKGYETETERRNALIIAAKEITIDLLNSGFKIHCYPHVSDVGRSVFEALYVWCKERNLEWFDHVKITSNGNINNRARKIYIDSKPTYDECLNFIFKMEKRPIIAEMEAVIILGGNRKTRFECELAIEEGTKFCPVPTFDGMGLDFWETHLKKELLPISNKETTWTQEMRKNLIRFINEK